LERIDLTRDLHFHTQTTIDTLDYSGEGLNSGSKVVFAAAGEKKRTLATELPVSLVPSAGFEDLKLAIPGVLVAQLPKYTTAETAKNEVALLEDSFKGKDLSGTPLIVLCDDAFFTAENINNLVWVTFTRSNPATDIHGISEFIENKHWGCNGSVIIDARKKPHHAPELLKVPEIEEKVNRLGEKGASLFGII
jgi:4-hydroxy-3-polyprenylbenzoate decarboxylase